MRNKLMTVFAVAAIAGINAYFTSPSEDAKSELLLENVESLAKVESDRSITQDQKAFVRPCVNTYYRYSVNTSQNSEIQYTETICTYGNENCKPICKCL